MRTTRFDWRPVLVACLALALLSLAFNVTTRAELEGRLQNYSMVRKSITKVLNSGTAWAAIAVYAGFKSPRARIAFLAGIGAAVVSLGVHYLVGSLLGIYPAGELATNGEWFVVSAVLCGPLGLAGWLATSSGRREIVGRLVVPLGALSEPFVLGRFTAGWPRQPWPEEWSDRVSGGLLLMLGVVGVVWAVRRGRRSPDHVAQGAGRIDSESMLASGEAVTANRTAAATDSGRKNSSGV